MVVFCVSAPIYLFILFRVDVRGEVSYEMGSLIVVVFALSMKCAMSVRWEISISPAEYLQYEDS